MTTEIRIEAEEARRLKGDTAFKQFMQSVRESQMQVFASSGAADVAAREEAHAMIRALSKLSDQMSRAVMAQKVERKRAAKKP